MRTPNFDREHELERNFGDERIERFVTPYYLKLASTNASTASRTVAQAVRRRSKELAVADIDDLLRMSWRPRVMGAWFAVAVGDESLSEAVHDSLETCVGRLTAPPLIIAALTYPSSRTVDLLLDYVETDRRHQWGASGFAAAAAAHLAPEVTHSNADLRVHREDLRQFDAMLEFADSLRTT